MQTSDKARELFGRRLAALRDRADLRQVELAAALTARGFPYSDNAVSGWERGVAWPPLLDVEFANALAAALKTDTKSMFSMLGFFPANGEIFTPEQIEVMEAFGKRDQQKLIEIAAALGREE